MTAQAEALAALIRKVDGRHDLSAAALAERLMEEGVILMRQPALESEALTLRERIPIVYRALRSAVGYMEGEGWDTDEQETALHVLRLMMVEANAAEGQP